MTAEVVVVGSVNVDLVFRVPRLPSVGETVTGSTFLRGPGGKGANQAAAAARLGARAWFVGMVGDDQLGQEARRDLEGSGVDVTGLGKATGHTGVAGILVGKGGDNLIAVASGANAELSEQFVREALAGIGAEAPVVLANLEIPEEAVSAAAEAAAEREWTFVLNPAPARALDRALLSRCSVLVPNEKEAEALESAEELLAAGVGAVVVTRGAEGADLHRPDRTPHRQPAFRVDVADTTGAGDAFCGALAWALAGVPEVQAAAAGALACSGVGARASLPTEQEVRALAGG
jgi:ribokinase